MIKTLMFDIGGTLLNAQHTPERDHIYGQIVKNRLHEIGIELPISSDELAQTIYTNSEEYKHWTEQSLVEMAPAQIWSKFILKDFNLTPQQLEPIAEELAFRFDFDRIINVPKDGLKETFKALKELGLNLGVISNVTSKTFVPYFLRWQGIDEYVDYVLLSSQPQIRKPNPKIFEIAMENMHATPETTGYVGDTISRDISGAINAHLALSVKIDSASAAKRDKAFQGPDAPKPDYKIEKISELVDLIRKINGGKV